MNNKNVILLLVLGLTISMVTPDFAHTSLEGSLEGIKYKLTGVILPLLSVIGLALAALSFFTGNPNAKQRAPQSV